MFLIKLILIILPFLFVSCSSKEKINLPKSETDSKIASYLQSAPRDAKERLGAISEKFLGVKYKFRTFGEGPQADIQRDPLYHLESFDCITYLEMVLAMYFSKDVAEFQKNIKKVRYHSSEISFLTRNHFAETEWIPNANRQGFLKSTIDDDIYKGSVCTLDGIVDKKNWLKKLSPAEFSSAELSKDEVGRRLEKLSETQGKEDFRLRYVCKNLFSNIRSAVGKIPENSVLFFIYNSPPHLYDLYGTPIYTRHAGLVLQKNGSKILRSASSVQKEKIVNDRDLEKYFSEVMTNDLFLGVAVYDLNTLEDFSKKMARDSIEGNRP